ncbi:hypothetical protein BFJ69_g7828 [Fusarium oxysporum]|uniref:Aldehyde dehydrogenase domain-containing protein n=1 Tax=Fusarium oxysporum TaxID=5507 RepID=A0A420N4Q2_FUSOX|nr:hypothetical protein BFJ69_g7828 [Fusarium oxysporum]
MIVDGVHSEMAVYSSETFGPVVGIVQVSDEKEAIKPVNDSEYGLTASIWRKDLHRVVTLARELNVGAVHMNAPTVHDEATPPHGGTKSS